MGDVEIESCFPTVLCNPSSLTFSVVLPNCRCFFGNMLASSSSHISQEKTELNGMRSLMDKASSSLHHTWVLRQGLSLVLHKCRGTFNPLVRSTLPCLFFFFAFLFFIFFFLRTEQD